jgi:hypothetical protein
MSSHILGKPASVIFRTEGMQTASVEYKTKRSSSDCVPEKIDQHEITFNVGFGRLLSCLLYGNVRSINAYNLKAVLGQPYGIVSSSTTNIQDLAAQNRLFGHDFDEVGVWPTDVPRCVP